MDTLKYTLPNNGKYFFTSRLLVSGICTVLNRDIEELEDLKMAVTEGLNIAMTLNCKDTVDLMFEISEDEMKITIDEICEDSLEDLEELALSRIIIETVMDEIKIENNTMILLKKLL